MVSARLAQIQDNLSHLYEQLGSKEKALIQADEEEKTRIEQEIWEIKKKIQRDEKELEGLGLKQDATGTKSKFVISLWPPKIEWTIEGEQNIQDVKKFLQENSQKFLQSMRLHRRKMVGVGLSFSLMGLSGVYVLQPEWLNPVIEALGLHQKTVKILVAEFDGPDPQKYRVTENILRAIKGKTKDYKDVEIVGLENRITEREGKVVARKVGLEQKADIVIWGWYGATDEKAQVSVNFELLTKLNGLPELGEEEQGKVRTMAVTELKSFRIQGNLAQELTYLSLVTLGVSRYAAEDWDGTITRLTNAQESMKVRSEALDPSAIYFYRATAYLRKGDKDHALTDYSKAIQLNPKLAKAYNNRGIIYRDKGDEDQAIVDYNQALQLNPIIPRLTVIGVIFIERRGI
jgi:tetratricopeptide (TPR) repeat protein